jgi:hypothetical protein
LPKDSDDEGERPVFRQVKAVTALRFVPACHEFPHLIVASETPAFLQKNYLLPF